MWSIRFLSGPSMGQTFQLKMGRNIVGRAPHCNVILASPNISKEHTQIEIYNDKIIVTDMHSRNGTFINGVQIKSHKLMPGERISFFDIMAVIEKPTPTTNRSRVTVRTSTPNMPPPNYNGNVAFNHVAASANTPAYLTEVLPPEQVMAHNTPTEGEKAAPTSTNNLKTYLEKYLNEVVLPGIYNILQIFEFKYVLGFFVGAFILLVTALSTIPLVRILKASIEKEAQNRAQTIARTLARDNRSAIMQGQLSLVTTENSDREAGATSYVISSLNGEILAPPRLAGQYLTNVEFVNEARKLPQEAVKQIDSETIVAVAPVRHYDSATSSESTSAHAVVVYNMGALAVDDGRTLSLFIQVLFIAMIIGGLLFFIMYKIILEPLNNLNSQLNVALRENKSQVSTSYLFPQVQSLIANINSLMSRGDGGFAGNKIELFEADRSQEMQNIVNLVGFAAITVSAADRTIVSTNDHFLTQIGTNGSWVNLNIDLITDQALKLNILGLLDRVTADPSQLVTDQLDIASQNYDISAQAIMGQKGIAYVLIVFVQKGGG